MWDTDAWKLYPNLRYFYDKLHLSTRLGYSCGPAGIEPSKPGTYVVRPITNLLGMGAGSYVKTVKYEEKLDIEPGKFWCQYFMGRHYSVDYSWIDGEIKPIFACMGFNSSSNLSKFRAWKRIYPVPHFNLPDWINETEPAKHINIEFINYNIIEIHLRHGQDFPKHASEIIPHWEDDEIFEERDKYFYKEDYDDANGLISPARLGFYYR